MNECITVQCHLSSQLLHQALCSYSNAVALMCKQAHIELYTSVLVELSVTFSSVQYFSDALMQPLQFGSCIQSDINDEVMIFILIYSHLIIKFSKSTCGQYSLL